MKVFYNLLMTNLSRLSGLAPLFKTFYKNVWRNLNFISLHHLSTTSPPPINGVKISGFPYGGEVWRTEKNIQLRHFGRNV